MPICTRSPAPGSTLVFVISLRVLARTLPRELALDYRSLTGSGEGEPGSARLTYPSVNTDAGYGSERDLRQRELRQQLQD
jgi:hypothetical protein